jgi:hypothetical protein
MKKQKLERKLTLSKKTVANLGNREMKEVKGGVDETFNYPTCRSMVRTCGTDEFCSCKDAHCA